MDETKSKVKKNKKNQASDVAHRCVKAIFKNMVGRTTRSVNDCGCCHFITVVGLRKTKLLSLNQDNWIPFTL